MKKQFLRRLPRWLCYVFAVLGPLLILALRMSIAESFFANRPLLIIFMFPIIISALTGGLWPGLLSTLVSAVGIDYLAIPPVGSLLIAHPRDLVQWLMLIFCGGLVSYLSEHVQIVLNKLQSSEERFRAVADFTQEWEYWRDPQGHMIWVSPSCERVTGYSVEEFTSDRMLVRNIVLPEDRDKYNDHIDKMDSDSPELCDMDIHIMRKDRETVWINHRCVALYREDGTYLGRRASNRDITRRKQAEELHEQIERIIQHDLRAPASSAVSVARLLRASENLTNDQLEILSLFEAAGMQMLDTLSSSLELYKIETGQYQHTSEVFDCAAVIRNLVQVLSAQFADIRLEILNGGLPAAADFRCLCQGQPHLLRMAVQNLLLNALEASSPGDTVTLGVSSGGDCRIEIRNSGTVPAEIRDRFFEKYVTSGKFKGTGLGTYSALMMAKAQGGNITMSTSDADNETVVTLRLPC